MEIEMRGISEAKAYSDGRVEALRKKLAELIKNDSVAVCIVGSFGRREASPLSDLDFFLLKDGTDGCEREEATLRRLLEQEGIKMPSKDGAFNSYVEECDDMARNIGGFDDRAEKLTRRLLFLMEGDWLYNPKLFNKCFAKLIGHYVRDTISEHQLCRFLLNDLIRYYRTICVDFEHKTHEGGKSWGDRNIKLQFSRKLLYFSGILVVAETWQHQWQTKREILEKNLRITPIDRVKTICGNQAELALSMYDSFLNKMSQDGVRTILEKTSVDRRTHTTEYTKFKNEG